ncbi:MAG: transcription termination factor NusA [Candidatus Izemoplasmatales bacterium]|uniref:Transcription termination/antitermination protein NusA n=1 Tax=Hujiaoplasma nucleasis TaxID=2725268 RepID=A0A7L6N6D0_9MOLU|nr:transcription termination factor NusA [Hujiaoplasma nucleasis]QLY40054.1 transcription termination/antitermination protein NusA [Hujiaoplasma nucleasis]
MISKDFFKALENLAIEKNVSQEEILKIFGDGLIKAYEKAYGGKNNAEVIFNSEKAEIDIVSKSIVVDEIDPNSEPGHEITLEQAREIKKNAKVGDIIKEKITPKNFGRLAASTAKQMLTQGLKQLERDKNYEYFESRVGEMIIAEVIKIKNDFVTLFLGRDTETSIPSRDLLASDLIVGSKVNVYITKVEKTNKDPKVYVSRTDRNLVIRLMENEIPELAEGIIEIFGLARDPGDRCKVCVLSNDENVDPVGACLGRNGMRIKNVIDSLNGEKIDIYKYSKNPEELIANSIQPARTLSVQYDEREKSAILVVPDDQLSLAIGKRGQNARLAVQSSGWKIDIKAESQALSEGIEF